MGNRRVVAELGKRKKHEGREAKICLKLASTVLRR